ncbi:MAG: hypothetical protein WB471_08275 [Nocardioides sp.]
MTPSWYDVLGVDPGAGSDEIRRVWKAAVADLDPGDRRYRLLNKAAEVLLDPASRAAHDRELEADAAEDDAQDADQDAALERDPAPGSSAPAAGQSPSRRAVARTAALGVAALLLLVTAVTSVVQAGDDTDPGGATLPDAREVSAARAAAEAAVVPVLSYDYRQLEQDKQAALSYMTPAYAAEYEQLFESVIAVNAPATETVVSVEVQASGVVRTGEDLVDVLLFVNRPTTNKQQTTPEIYKDQATLRMRDLGGEWLVDCVISGSGSTCED